MSHIAPKPLKEDNFLLQSSRNHHHNTAATLTARRILLAGCDFYPHGDHLYCKKSPPNYHSAHPTLSLAWYYMNTTLTHTFSTVQSTLQCTFVSCNMSASCARAARVVVPVPCCVLRSSRHSSSSCESRSDDHKIQPPPPPQQHVCTAPRSNVEFCTFQIFKSVQI